MKSWGSLRTRTLSVELQSLEGIDAVLLDSRAALDHARFCCLERGARVYTCSPALAGDAGVTPLESTADSGTIRRIAEVIAQLGERLHEVVSSDPNWSDRALTIARLALSMELPTYKALILMRSVGEAGSIAAVEPRLVKGHCLIGLWEELLNGMPGFEGSCACRPSGCRPAFRRRSETPPLSRDFALKDGKASCTDVSREREDSQG